MVDSALVTSGTRAADTSFDRCECWLLHCKALHWRGGAGVVTFIVRLVQGYTIRRYAPMVITVMRQVVVDTGLVTDNSSITLVTPRSGGSARRLRPRTAPHCTAVLHCTVQCTVDPAQPRRHRPHTNFPFFSSPDLYTVHSALYSQPLVLVMACFMSSPV